MGSVTVETASLSGFLYGTQAACTYDNWISHVAEGQVSGLNVYSVWDVQTVGFGDFVIPTSEQLSQWEQVVLRWLSLDMAGADSLLAQYQFPYETVIFQDIDSGRELYMLRENLNGDVDTNLLPTPEDDETGSFDYGWGLYIYAPDASRPVIVTVPHPCDDYPSPVIGLQAFQTLDARFLMIAGAGREVAYFPPYNSNNQSISDPSRFADHPFNVAYQRAADQIRSITGRMEFSLQVHTYDWYKYSGDNPVMLSAGNGRQYPALPMRDASRSKNDLIHHTPFVVVPQGGMELANEVSVDEYYCAYYSSGYPIRYQKDGHDVLIPFNRNLPGALDNRQMLYTEPQNTYDVYSPFLHVEMDELPRFWPQEMPYLKWFYGWNNETQEWDIGQRWTRFIAFYTPWIDALNASLNAMLTLDDGTGPSNPENLRVSQIYSSEVNIAWDRAYSYDFDSYVVHIRYQTGDTVVTNTYDRHDEPILAWQLRKSFTFSFPTSINTIYVSLQARDKHGNSSIITPEIKVQRQPSWPDGIDDISATPLDGGASLAWEGEYSGAVGYNVNRSAPGQAWTRIASWRDYPSLLVNASETYQFVDSGLVNGIVYSYQISVEYSAGDELFYYKVLPVQPQKYITLRVLNLGNALTDSLRIGINQFANDGYDDLDITRSPGGLPSTALLSWDEADEVYFRQDVKSTIDPAREAKMWSIKSYNTVSNYQMQLSVDASALPHGWGMQVRDVSNGRWHDLSAAPYIYQHYGGAWKDIELWLGYLPPQVIIADGANIIQPASQPLNLAWDVVSPSRLQHLAVKLVSPSDSLVVADILPPVVESYVYLAPPAGISGARLVIEAYDLQGLVSRTESDWLVDLLPSQMVYTAPAGFSMISVPTPDYSQPLVSLLGSQAHAWKLGEANFWQPYNVISSGAGYLVHNPTPYQFILPAVAYGTAYSCQLHQGWNLLPNPHYRNLNLSSLRFDISGELLGYDELLRQNAIAPRVMIYTSDGWVDTDRVPPLHAFLLYYCGQGTPTLTIDPQQDDGSALAHAFRWSVLLSASDGFTSGDAVRIGVADSASVAFDACYDLPKAPSYPMANIRLALRQLMPDDDVIDLQSSLRELFPDSNPTEMEWPFRITIPSQHTIAFRLSSFGLPDTYSVSIQIGAILIDIASGQTRWWDPPSTGTFAGNIIIRSYTQPAYRGNDVTSADANIWPNPFSTAVHLDLGKLVGERTSVSVYNIRGQKVREIFNGMLSKAASLMDWDGRDHSGSPVAAGMYIIRVSTDRSRNTYKVLRIQR